MWKCTNKNNEVNLILEKRGEGMENYKMGEVELQFAEIIWEKEPLGSGTLVKLAAQKLGWKKSTTYTVLKKLCTKGIFQNQDSVVSSVLNKEQYYGRQAKSLVEEGFGGSLPKFLAAFTAQEKMSKKEIEDLRRFIDEAGK